MKQISVLSPINALVLTDLANFRVVATRKLVMIHFVPRFALDWAVILFPPPPILERNWDLFRNALSRHCCNHLITKSLGLWRRGESNRYALLKTRNLLKTLTRTIRSNCTIRG